MSYICHHGQPILNSKLAYNERPGIYARCNGDGNSNQKGDEDALKLRRSRIAHIDNVGVYCPFLCLFQQALDVEVQRSSPILDVVVHGTYTAGR